MKNTIRPFTNILFTTCFSLICLMDVVGIMAATTYPCSSNKGQVVINEVYHDGGNSFIELAFQETYYNYGYELCYSDKPNGNGNQTCLNITGKYYAGDYKVIEISKLSNFDADQGEIIIRHFSMVIDYFRYGSGDICDDDSSFRWATDSICSDCLNTRDSSQKDMSRLADTIGGFVDNENNVTRGYENDGTISLPTPVADYHLDECSWEGSGTRDVMDSSGNNLNGTAVLPPVSVDVSSELGGVCQAASMGGVSHLSVADNDLLDIPNNLTAMAWIKPNSYPTGGNIKSILSKDENYEFHIKPNGRIYWWWRWEGQGGNPQMTTTDTVPLGSWSHVAVRFSNGVSTIFINGQEVMESTWNSSYQLDVNGDVLQIGGDFIGSRYFDGSLDEIMIFDEALSQSQISSIYTSQLNGRNYDDSERICVECESLSESIVLSFSYSGEIGSPALSFESSDLIDYVPSTKEATLVKRMADEFNWGSNEVSAAHIDQDGNIYFSPVQDGLTNSGLNVDRDDILKFDSVSGEITRVFNGDDFFQNSNENIDALYIYESTGEFLISTDGNFKFQGTSTTYTNSDLVRFDPDNPAGTASLYFDGSDHFSSGGNINGVHIISDKQLLLTTENNSTLGALTFRWTDIALYSPVARVASLYLDGVVECNDNWIDIDSITTTNSTVAIDHYEIVHDGSALTCGAEEITVVACEDSDCNVEYSGATTVTMTPTGWIGGDNLSFTGSGTAEIRNNSGGAITLGMSDQTVTPLNGYKCVQTIGAEAVSCELMFYNSGFDFDIPTQTSCKTSDDITIRAVRKDDVTQQCVPAFADRTVSVPFYSTYTEPDSGTESVLVNSTSVSTSTPGTDISLDFDTNGESSFTVNYPDAGKITLYAHFEGTGDETDLVMDGNDSFVVHPAGLCVYSDQADNDCASGDANCSSFVAAGTEFSLKVKGVCWQQDSETDEEFCTGNTTTPNYQHAGISLTHSLIAPNTGVIGTIGITSVDISTDGGGEVAQTVSEVGVFTFTADPPDDYLGAGDVYGGATFTSANIGRFVPDHFDVTILPDPPEFQDQCNDIFTYLGQPFDWEAVPEVTITAMNGADTPEVTTNYEGDFWKLDTLIQYTYTDASGASVAASFNPSDSQQSISSVTDINGTATIELLETAGFNYTRPDPTSPVDLFNPMVTFTISTAELTDSDGVCYESSGSCTDFSQTGITGASIRHGRILVYDNYGPELDDIELSPFETQYWDDSSWITNSDDDCSAPIVFDTTRASVTSVPEISAGLGTITVTADGTATAVQVNASSPSWLSCPADSECSGWFTFGISRGNDRIINWKEIAR